MMQRAGRLQKQAVFFFPFLLLLLFSTPDNVGTFALRLGLGATRKAEAAEVVCAIENKDDTEAVSPTWALEEHRLRFPSPPCASAAADKYDGGGTGMALISAEKARSCLKGKRLRFIGDSQTRDLGLGVVLFLHGADPKNVSDQTSFSKDRRWNGGWVYPLLKNAKSSPDDTTLHGIRQEGREEATKALKKKEKDIKKGKKKQDKKEALEERKTKEEEHAEERKKMKGKKEMMKKDAQKEETERQDEWVPTERRQEVDKEEKVGRCRGTTKGLCL